MCKNNGNERSRLPYIIYHMFAYEEGWNMVKNVWGLRLGEMKELPWKNQWQWWRSLHILNELFVNVVLGFSLGWRVHMHYLVWWATWELIFKCVGDFHKNVQSYGHVIVSQKAGVWGCSMNSWFVLWFCKIGDAWSLQNGIIIVHVRMHLTKAANKS